MRSAVNINSVVKALRLTFPAVSKAVKQLEGIGILNLYFFYYSVPPMKLKFLILTHGVTAEWDSVSLLTSSTRLNASIILS